MNNRLLHVYVDGIIKDILVETVLLVYAIQIMAVCNGVTLVSLSKQNICGNLMIFPQRYI